MKKIFFSAIFFSLTLSIIEAKENKFSDQFRGCKGQLSENFIHYQDKIKIKKIEIDTKNYRKWTVNGIRILTNRYRYVDDRYKKRFDSIVSVTFEDNTYCVFDARIRHSGDEKDHISLLENSITQSLDIHLKNGNIRGITKFKLLRPRVRGILEDEIFLTEILRNLNFIAPRTVKVFARVNRLETTMLFQEKAAKEMLEFNKRREGPFFEGDERFFFKKVDKLEDNHISGWSIGVVDLMNQNAKHMLAKQVNSEIILKSRGHKLMSLDSTSKLNFIYLYFASRFQDKLNKFNYMEYDLDNSLLALFDKSKTLKLDEYNLLIQAVNGHHGLAVNNRKFFWNSIENYFEPINYDSNANIDLGIAPGQLRLPISREFFSSFQSLRGKLNNLDSKKLIINLRLSGLEINKKEIDKKINQIIKNIDQLEENYLDLDKNLIEHNRYKKIEEIAENYKENLKKSEIDITLIKYNTDDKKFNKCENFLENCEFFNISEENLSTLLEGELTIKKKPYQYYGTNSDLENFKRRNFENFIKLNDTEIYFNNGIKFNYEEPNNVINITQTISGAKILFFGGDLINKKIIFQSEISILDEENNIVQDLKNYSSTDVNGLTGCLTFSNIALEKVSIQAIGSTCEDTINLINVSGNLRDINIENSYSDALDIDFSNVKINNIVISNSGNDCVDFSLGRYFVDDLNLNKCGDKGISIGEKSFAELKKLEVTTADIGLASKDSSITVVHNSLFNNVNTCVSAYNKKQEFDGSITKIKNLKCKNFQSKIELDARSKLIKENRSLN